jgi:hypothetical protein
LDGGFPFRHIEGYPSTLNHTHAALLFIDELGLLGCDEGIRVFHYLVKTQKTDGGWDEAELVAGLNPPPWMFPGEINARLYLTVQSAFWLGIGGYINHAAFKDALDFLQQHQDTSGTFQGFLHTTWIATSVFALAGTGYEANVTNGLAALKRKPLEEWVDSNISWALSCLGAAGMTEEEPFIKNSLIELEVRMVSNGVWISEDGEDRTASTVLEVLKMFRHFGKV